MKGAETTMASKLKRDSITAIAINPAGAVVLGLILWSAPAAADPLRVTTGVISLNSEGGLTYRLQGTTFSITKDFSSFFWDSTGMDIGCFTEGGCGNNELFSFSTNTFDHVSLGHGDAIVMESQFGDVDLTGTWSLTSPGARLPSSPDRFASLTAPFEFTGTISGMRNGVRVFSLPLVGSGRADVFVARTGPGGWQIDEADSVHYVFSDAVSAVPEPSTMVLLGSGIAAVINRRRRKY